MRKGFTLIELLITISIIVVLGVVATLNLSGTRNGDSLKDTTQDVASSLREAQSDSVAESHGAAWGVHFDNTNPAAPFYSLFYTTNGAYASSTIAGEYPLPGGMCYTTSTVAQGSSVNIIFNEVSGATSNGTSTSIGLQVGGCGTASTSTSTQVITQSASGEIFFDNFGRTNL
jgi:prepilin-type N-terminal cleavage/methylation domain-containing protein